MKNPSKKWFLTISLGSMLLLYGLFFLFPISYGWVGSFADWDPIRGSFLWKGLGNYAELFRDSLFWRSLGNTLWFTVVCTLATTALGLVLAFFIQGLPRMRGFFKGIIYMPYVTSIMAIAVVWRWIFMARGGLLNNILAGFGVLGPDWLNNSATVMPSLMLMTVWHDVGFALILFIAGLSEISPNLYEAAAIDGAGRPQIFLRITIPMLAPTTALVAVSNIITYVQVYDQVVSLTKGGPGDASTTASYYLFTRALGQHSHRFGYASAIAVTLLIVILLLSMLQMRMSESSDKVRG